MKRLTILLLLSTLLAAHPAERPTVFLIGDSTMADKPQPERNPYRGWGQMLHEFLDDGVMVRNFAVNGRSTKSFIDEGRWEAVRAQLRPGDYVIIQFGHNDEKKQDSTRYTDPATTFRENLARFVRDTRDRGATPILFTSIVRRKFAADGTLEDTHGAYLDATRAVADSLQVPLVDLEKMTRELVFAAGPEKSKALYAWVEPGTNEMYPRGLKDDTHLSVAGGREVAKLAARGLKALGLPLSRDVVNVD